MTGDVHSLSQCSTTQFYPERFLSLSLCCPGEADQLREPSLLQITTGKLRSLTTTGGFPLMSRRWSDRHWKLMPTLRGR